MAAIQALNRSLRGLQRDPVENCSAAPEGDDLFHWKATIVGPTETPYEGGTYHLDMKFPQEFPFRPPKVVFETPIFHCNITLEGEIEIDILRETWSPAYQVRHVLLSISSVMADPDPECDLQPEVGRLLRQNRSLFAQEANKHAAKHTEAPLKTYLIFSLPEITSFVATYRLRNQVIECNISTNNSGFIEKFEYMQFVFMIGHRRETRPLDPSQNAYHHAITQTIDYGESLEITCYIEFKTDQYRSDHPDFNGEIYKPLSKPYIQNLYVTPLSVDQSNLLIEGYARELLNNINRPQEMIQICFDYFWKYHIAATIRDFQGTVHKKSFTMYDVSNIPTFKTSVVLDVKNIAEWFDWDNFVRAFKSIKFDQPRYEVYPMDINGTMNAPRQVNVTVDFQRRVKRFELRKDLNQYFVEYLIKLAREEFGISEELNVNLSYNRKRIVTPMEFYDLVILNGSCMCGIHVGDWVEPKMPTREEISQILGVEISDRDAQTLIKLLSLNPATVASMPQAVQDKVNMITLRLGWN